MMPFRRQVRETGTCVTSTLGNRAESLIIDTVERLQGQSVEVAIISLACSDVDYVSRVADFYFTDNRWNVALSRAKTKVIIIGSPAVLRARPWSLRAARALHNLATILGRIRTIELE